MDRQKMKMIIVKDKILSIKMVSSGYLVYIMLLALFIIARLMIPGFLSISNLSSILKIAAFTGIAAIGQTLVILLGGIDMSISNVVTFVNIVAAQVMVGANANIPVAILSVVLIGIAVGFVNSIGINKLKIPPLVMTLGSGTILQGLALIYSKGAPKGNAAPIIRTIVNKSIIGDSVSFVVIIWLFVSVATIVILKYTIAGRKLYAVGANSVSAKFAGIKNSKIITISYIISGVSGAVTGLMLTGYTGTASMEAGVPYSMNSIVAVVLGGTAITGGKGGYAGTIAGVLIMTVLDSILTVLNIPEAGTMILQGIIILFMVMVYGRQSKEVAGC